MRALRLVPLALFVALPACGQGAGWSAVRGQIARQFPGVRQLPPDTLAAWQRAGRSVVLVDVREAAEFAVSRLPGARRIAPGADAAALADVPKSATVVAYCSVGWRSSAFAERLRQAGFADVANLDGAIFRWANEGRSLVDAAGQSVRLVHPYNRLWGRLLRPHLRAPLRAVLSP